MAKMEKPPLPPKLCQRCRIEDFEEEFGLFDNPDFMPCQHRLRLNAEDEISVDSIISDLLHKVAPREEELVNYSDWQVDANDMLNAKQAVIYDEHLYVSRLKDTNCKLSESSKIFLERELQEIGDFCLNVEESYDGYVVFSKCKMLKAKGSQKCGHVLKGKYDDNFALICERRMEFDYVDKARIEKHLNARIKEHELHATRESKINGESQKLKTTVNVKDRDTTFVLDGGVMLLMRHLIVNNFRGEYEYYSMNLFGKIIRCVLCVHEERQKLRIFYRNYDNIILVRNTQYFNDVAESNSETYYQANGRIVLHYWHGYNYLLHALRAPVQRVERILPRMELMWKTDDLLFRKYQRERKLNYENASDYLNEHPECGDYLQDYVNALLKYKPPKVLEFTVKFFHNMRSTY